MSVTKRIVAVYCRVSSDDQRNRETIRTQVEVIERYLATHALEVYRWYKDDGVSGTIPMGQRPAGKLLLDDAVARRFEAVVVVRADRLGRDAVDLLQVHGLFTQLGIDLIGAVEPIGDEVLFGIKAVLSADERKKFLARSAEGMTRAAREGRYTGGIVPFGFIVDGAKQSARLAPDERPFWGETSAAELVRQMYAWLLEGRSCYWIADHLNDLGVPTHYTRDGRLLKDSQGRRTKRTQGVWRPGRVRNLVVNPVYKGELTYGRRAKNRREVIVAQVPPLVPEDVWDLAQQTLQQNRIIRRRAESRVNVLRSVVICAICGLHYSATAGRDDIVWLRDNGQIAHRGKIQGRCPSKSIKLSDIAPVVLADIETFLRDPGEIIDELRNTRDETSGAATAEAERIAIEGRLATVPQQRKAILGRLRNGKISEAECDDELDDIARLEEKLRRRLAELMPAPEPDDAVDADLLAEIRRRLDAGLDDLLWQEVVQHLVRSIVVHTETDGTGKKSARIVVSYRFPAVAPTDTGRGSSPRRA